jgi:hypothetical protein
MLLFDTALLKGEQDDWYARACHCVDNEEVVEMKNCLEEYFNRFPESHKQNIQKRFADTRLSNHCGVFFELICHEWFLEHGYEVKCLDKDSNENKTPDFLISREGIPQFYVECTAVTESESEIAHHRKMDLIEEWIEKEDLPTGFGLAIQYVPSNGQHPNKKAILDFLKEKLATLKSSTLYETTRSNKEFEEGVFNQFGERMFCQKVRWSYRAEDGFVIGFIPRKLENEHEKTHCYTSTPDALGESDGDLLIIKKLKGKYSKRQNLEHDVPFLIACNLMRPLHIGEVDPHEFDIWTALLGQYSVTISNQSNKAVGEGHSLQESFWFKSSGETQHTSCSAVMFWSVKPWNFQDRRPIIWHHLFAKKPIDLSHVSVPQWVRKEEGMALINHAIAQQEYQ